MSQQNPDSSVISRWTHVSHTELLEILRGEDAEAINEAMSFLQQRYNSQLHNLAVRSGCGHLADDVLSVVWLKLYERACTGRIKLSQDIGAYVYGIARNTIADLIDRERRERELEKNDLPVLVDTVSRGDLSEGIDYGSLYDEQLDYVPELSFLNYVLSDADRVPWALREVYGYPVQTIDRLLGKTANDTSVRLKRARASVAKYFRSEDFKITVEACARPRLWGPPAMDESAEVIERFSKDLIPDLRPDEWDVLGLSPDEFSEDYVASLMIPRWFPIMEKAFKPSLPYMLLAKKTDWPVFSDAHSRIAADPDDMPDEFPEEALVKLDIDGRNIALSPVTSFQIVPDFPGEERMGNTYLALHGSLKRVPVIMAFIGSELYTDEFRERWPFLTPGWEERETPVDTD